MRLNRILGTTQAIRDFLVRFSGLHEIENGSLFGSKAFRSAAHRKPSPTSRLADQRLGYLGRKIFLPLSNSLHGAEKLALGAVLEENPRSAEQNGFADP